MSRTQNTKEGNEEKRMYFQKKVKKWKNKEGRFQGVHRRDSQHYTLFMVFHPTDELARFCG